MREALLYRLEGVKSIADRSLCTGKCKLSLFHMYACTCWRMVQSG